MRHEERFWAKRAMEGDGSAFGLLASRYLPHVEKWIGIRVSPEKVEDLAQETMLRAFESVDRLSDPARFPQWLRGISLNVVRMHYRSEAKAPPSTAGDLIGGNGSGNEHVEGHQTEYQVIDKLRSFELIEALRGLNAAQQEALTLHYLDGMSYEQIANRMGISIAAVKSRMHRGRLEMRHHLAAREEAPMDDSKGLKQATIHDLYRATLEGEDPLAIVILKPIDQDVFVPIWVPDTEGVAILMSLKGETAPRPLTHDLMYELLKSTGAIVERVAVTDLREDVYYGEVRVRGRKGAVDIDARPSDAIALALQTGAELLVSQQVIEDAGKGDTSPDTLRRNPEVKIVPLELPDFSVWAKRP